MKKYGANDCSLGLDEKELLPLTTNKDLSLPYTPETEEPISIERYHAYSKIVEIIEFEVFLHVLQMIGSNWNDTFIPKENKE